MTPAQQIRLAGVIQSIYDSAPVPAGWDLLDRLFVPEDKPPVALLLRDQETKKIALAVRGSWTGWDWAQDFRFVFRSSPWGVGRTETGFTNYYLSATTESGDALRPIDWLGGHSLAGPAATYFGCNTIPGADLLLAASPEPGDAAFANWASPRFANIHRWENPADIVPDAPGRFRGYRDLLGEPTVIDMKPLGPPTFDPLDPIASVRKISEFNHSLKNYMTAAATALGIAA